MDTRSVLGHDYLPRAVDGDLQRRLRVAGAVLIEGPRGCGKTMTGLHSAQSYAFLDDEETASLGSVMPSALLEGESPRLLDEWQLAPELWNLVRRAVDRDSRRGRFILTGSSVPADDVTRHTGAGRFLRLRMRTMSWWERGESTGEVSLEGLFEGDRPRPAWDTLDYDEVIDRLLRSGFPALRNLEASDSLLAMSGYLDDIARADLPRLASIRHSPRVVSRLIRSLARRSASEAKVSALAADLEGIAPRIRPETVSSYLELLESLFVVERVGAWAPGLRSRARLRTSTTLHLADPALASAALGADRSALRADVRTAGFLFESAAVHDLLVYASALGGQVHHYRDSNGRELDAVITLPGGRWAAVEVKLGGGQVPAGMASAAQAVAGIDTDLEGEPSFILVVTGTGPTLVSDDGVITCPLSALRP
ncbi:ATP-binding protein [Actinomyces slackii]|uniref:ATP-binding protein n=1 Tax=Actinomyces slackii TaxID=52774 RepID=A0A448K9T4_9ACTO|nr:Uncharacterised protein [Actinomyces slackii]